MIFIEDTLCSSVEKKDHTRTLMNKQTQFKVASRRYLNTHSFYSVEEFLTFKNYSKNMHKFFSSPPRPERLWGPPSRLSNGYQGSFPGHKAAGREADLSPPSSAEVKERVELYFHFPNTPLWRGAQLKHRDNFTFLYFIFTLRALGQAYLAV
jgi:hypothetical protein